MKTALLLIASLNLALSSAAARADGLNLPELAHPTPVGRLMAFPSVKGVTWFLASGLSSEMDCSPALPSGSSRVCSIRIFNTVSGAETAGLEALLPAGGNYDGFRDFNSNIVTAIDERFEPNIDPLKSGSTSFLKTLAVSDKFPYASLLTKVTPDEANRLLLAYGSQGLGDFVSEVTIAGEKTETYLAIQGTDPLHAALEKVQSQGGMNGVDFKALVTTALGQSILVRAGLELNEAQPIAYEYILTHLMQLGSHGRFQVKPGVLDMLGKTLLILDETYSPIPMKCRVVLPIKKNAQGSVSCIEQEGS